MARHFSLAYWVRLRGQVCICTALNYAQKENSGMCPMFELLLRLRGRADAGRHQWLPPVSGL